MAVTIGEIKRLAKVISKDVVQTELSKKSINHVYNEVPFGVQDGVNTIFTLNNSPDPETIRLTINGIRDNNFSISSQELTIMTPPIESDIIYVDYSY